MTLWIDEPIWPAHGRLFGHLVSDASYDELHSLAARAGLHPRAFEGDHYDVPQERWQQVVDAGATPTTGVDLARRLNASGLRLRKRKGDRGLVRHLNHPFPNGVSHVDVLWSEVPVPEPQVFAAMVFIRDAAGDFVAVHSIRRDEWGSPGGWREGDETPSENAMREAHEETGLVIAPDALRVVGHERFTPVADNLIDASKPYLQVFSADLPDIRPAINEGDDGIKGVAWMTPREYAAHCRHLFWWPLAVEAFPDSLAEFAARR